MCFQLCGFSYQESFRELFDILSRQLLEKVIQRQEREAGRAQREQGRKEREKRAASGVGQGLQAAQRRLGSGSPASHMQHHSRPFLKRPLFQRIKCSGLEEASQGFTSPE